MLTRVVRTPIRRLTIGRVLLPWIYIAFPVGFDGARIPRVPTILSLVRHPFRILLAHGQQGVFVSKIDAWFPPLDPLFAPVLVG